MPPRYAYWTILIGDEPTAFRASALEDIMPTFNRLKEKQPDAVLKWFQNGKLWTSRIDAREAMDYRGDKGKRNDPRQKQPGYQGWKGKPAIADAPAGPKAPRGERAKPEWKPKGEVRPEWKPKGATRPEWKRSSPKPEASSRDEKPTWKKPEGFSARGPRPEWKPKGAARPDKQVSSPEAREKPAWKPRGATGEKPAWKPKSAAFARGDKPAWKSKPEGGKPVWKPKGEGFSARGQKPDWKPKAEGRPAWQPKGAARPFERSEKPEWKPKTAERPAWKPKSAPRPATSVTGRSDVRDKKWRPGGEHQDPRQKYKDAKKAKWTRFKQAIRARTGHKKKPE